MAEELVKMLIKNPKATSRWFGRSPVGTEVMIPANAAEDLKRLGDVVYAPVTDSEPDEAVIRDEPIARPVDAMSLEGEQGNLLGDPETGPEIDTPSSSQSGEEEPLS